MQVFEQNKVQHKAVRGKTKLVPRCKRYLLLYVKQEQNTAPHSVVQRPAFWVSDQKYDL